MFQWGLEAEDGPSQLVLRQKQVLPLAEVEDSQFFSHIFHKASSKGKPAAHLQTASCCTEPERAYSVVEELKTAVRHQRAMRRA